MTERAGDGPWPELIMRSFSVAGAEKPFYGPWNRLLTTLFPPDTTFEVVPHYLPPMAQGRDFAGFAVFLVVYMGTSPVFIVEIKHPDEFELASNREEADLQLRRRFLDCIDNLTIPVLHGVCAFGTKLAFYKYHKSSGQLEPRRIVSDLDVLTDTAPRQWWTHDVLEEEGAKKFRTVVNEVKAMATGRSEWVAGLVVLCLLAFFIMSLSSAKA